MGKICNVATSSPTESDRLEPSHVFLASLRGFLHKLSVVASH